MALTVDDVKHLLSHGWNRNKILELDILIKDKRLTAIYPWGAIIDERYIAYKNETFDRLAIFMYHRQVPEEPFVCYTDGSGTTSDKPAGSGAVIYEPGQPALLLSENIGQATNNIAEIRAIWLAIRNIPDLLAKISINSDSEYSLGALTKDWTINKNADLILTVREDLSIRKPNVNLSYVAGHKGVAGNEIADRLANIARKFLTG